MKKTAMTNKLFYSVCLFCMSACGCSMICHPNANTTNSFDRSGMRDNDLSGLTFYVSGGFPEKVAGYRIFEGSYHSVENLVEQHNGVIAKSHKDKGIDIAIIGSVRSPYEGDFDHTLIEKYNEERNLLLQYFFSHNIEVIDVEVLLSRLSKGKYYTEGISRKTGVWDYQGDKHVGDERHQPKP